MANCEISLLSGKEKEAIDIMKNVNKTDKSYEVC